MLSYVGCFKSLDTVQKSLKSHSKFLHTIQIKIEITQPNARKLCPTFEICMNLRPTTWLITPTFGDTKYNIHIST